LSSSSIGARRGRWPPTGEATIVRIVSMMRQ
jgi:hypothetical protein